MKYETHSNFSALSISNPTIIENRVFFAIGDKPNEAIVLSLDEAIELSGNLNLAINELIHRQEY